MTDFLTSPQGRRLAFDRTAGKTPGLVFLGGYNSDMEGTKARYLHEWAQSRGRAFLRFDYSGHGTSGGAFEDGCIGDWRDDALAVIDKMTAGPQVLVGSSMGGWIALLLARAMPERVAGLVGIAAAPDFTTITWSDELTEDQRQEVLTTGRTTMQSNHADHPFVFTRKLFDDGARQRVMTAPLPLLFPVRLLQGTADTDVLPQVALDLLAHATSPDLRLTLVKDADHRFSTPECLALIADAVEDVLEKV